MLVNTLTADGKYPVHYGQNFLLQTKMQLSKKRKTCSDFFVWFHESTSNFKHFEKNDDGHSLYISELIDCENLG